MTVGLIVVIAVAIIFVIALLITGAVFLARKLDRDEPGGTVVRSFKDEYRRRGGL